MFLCIRCAGIHRNLGVHISRVKSVNLDSWTPEQMDVSMKLALYETIYVFKFGFGLLSLRSFVISYSEHSAMGKQTSCRVLGMLSAK